VKKSTTDNDSARLSEESQLVGSPSPPESLCTNELLCAGWRVALGFRERLGCSLTDKTVGAQAAEWYVRVLAAGWKGTAAAAATRRLFAAGKRLALFRLGWDHRMSLSRSNVDACAGRRECLVRAYIQRAVAAKHEGHSIRCTLETWSSRCRRWDAPKKGRWRSPRLVLDMEGQLLARETHKKKLQQKETN
jgi:hypothetical protein